MLSHFFKAAIADHPNQLLLHLGIKMLSVVQNHSSSLRALEDSESVDLREGDTLPLITEEFRRQLQRIDAADIYFGIRTVSIWTRQMNLVGNHPPSRTGFPGQKHRRQVIAEQSDGSDDLLANGRFGQLDLLL